MIRPRPWDRFYCTIEDASCSRRQDPGFGSLARRRRLPGHLAQSLPTPAVLRAMLTGAALMRGPRALVAGRETPAQPSPVAADPDRADPTGTERTRQGTAHAHPRGCWPGAPVGIRSRARDWHLPIASRFGLTGSPLAGTSPLQRRWCQAGIAEKARELDRLHDRRNDSGIDRTAGARPPQPPPYQPLSLPNPGHVRNGRSGVETPAAPALFPPAGQSMARPQTRTQRS